MRTEEGEKERRRKRMRGGRERKSEQLSHIVSSFQFTLTVLTRACTLSDLRRHLARKPFACADTNANLLLLPVKTFKKGQPLQ